MKRSDLNSITRSSEECLAQHTVPANEPAIKALRCPLGRVRAVSTSVVMATRDLVILSPVAGSATRDMPLGGWPDVTIADARKRISAIVVPILDGVDPWGKRAEDWRRQPGIRLNDVEWLESAADQAQP